MSVKRFFILDRSDLLVMLVSSPVIFLANYLILGDIYISNLDVFVPTTLGLTCLYVAFSWLLNGWMKYMRYRFEGLEQVMRRIIYCIIFYMIAAFLVAWLVFALYDWFDVSGYRYDPITFRWTVLIGWTSNLISIGITESFYSYRQWKDSVTREYEIRQLHMQRQLDVLKQQVNPHFLFNSLNSLLSLIEDDPKRAGIFVEELSSVYRYVLRANRTEGPDHNLTDLDTELDFIQSYFHLLKTRHSSGLDLVVSVDEGTRAKLLPPLTLQLLIENAVKHNIVLPEQPLKIEITTDGKNNLLVKNTLQKKRSRVASNGVGLSNILTKYDMLGQPLPKIEEAGGHFIVTLPLISTRLDC
jgi:hypothetical protein